MGEARQVVDRFYASFAAGDWDEARACYADDCVTVMPGGMEIVRAVENGNEVFVGGTFAGTHTGDMVTPQGTMPASGGTLALPYADYFRVEGGKIVEHNVVFDQLTFASQLGAGPG